MIMRPVFIFILLFCFAGNVSGQEKKPDWEVSIKGQGKALLMPWRGPFASTLSVGSGVRIVTKEFDEAASDWFYGGGVKVESFYKKHLFGERSPIELGFRGYYNSYKTRFTPNVFQGQNKIRVGWSYIDGVSPNADSNAFLLPKDIVYTSVTRQIRDFGIDLIARQKFSLHFGELQLMAGPSFFRMTQRTEIFAFDYEDRTVPGLTQHLDPAYAGLDTGGISEDIDANYYGIKVGADLALPVSENITFIVVANVGGYVLDAFYEGAQHTDFSFTPVTNRTAWDHHAMFSYTSELEAGLQYDTGFGIIGFSGEARYLSKVPLVKYIAVGTDVTLDYGPARLGFDDTYSYGANIEFKYVF